MTLGSIQSEAAIERLLQAQTLTHYATAAVQTLATAGTALRTFTLTSLLADPLAEAIPDRDCLLDGVLFQITSAANVTTLAWALFHDAAGALQVTPWQTSTPIWFVPGAATTGSVVATLAAQPYMKMTGLGTAGALYLRAEVAGAGATLDLKPYLFYRATLNDSGVYK